MLTSNGKSLDKSKLKQIAAGGEGTIYEIGSKVLKVYHTPRPKKFESHLKDLSKLDKRFVKPLDIWYKGVDVAGFEMEYVDLNNYWLLNNLFNKGFCQSNKIDKPFKIKILNNLKEAVEFAHSKDVVIGDLNQYNIFVKRDGSVLFCDVDSFATPSQPHSGILIDEIRDWTTISIDKNTDVWAYNILTFWCTTFVHPFKWVCPGNTETLEQRVRQGKSILTKITGVKIPACYDTPDPVVVPQFEEVFKGRRYFVNFNGVSTINVVIPKNISSTDLNITHLFDDVTKVRATNNQVAVLQNGTWLLLDSSFQGRVLQKSQFTCDELLVGQKEVLYLKANKLYDKNNNLVREFSNYHYYSNDSLMIVDYDKDIQYIYNIDNQLAGVEQSQVPVFAKSILFNGCAIQNFGSKKYINVPNGKSHSLLEVGQGTKAAIYNQGWAVTEGIEKGKVRFTLFKPSSHKLETGIELDYLPHFCVKGDFLFVPDDGFIGLLKDGVMINKFNCDCTRDSKLFQTNSGILMLENNSLYLLNTK